LLNWLLKATEAQEGKVHGSLAVLYDIGCTLQKGIIKVSITSSLCNIISEMIPTKTIFSAINFQKQDNRTG
jgi:hypothetical protein